MTASQQTSIFRELKESVEALRQAFDSFKSTLPEAYPPRREVETRFTAMRDTATDMHVRLTALEEWRLAETRRVAESNAALQTQIYTTSIQAMKDISQTREQSQQAVATDRQTSDTRTITLFQAIIFMLISTGISTLVMVIWYLVQHAR